MIKFLNHHEKAIIKSKSAAEFLGLAQFRGAAIGKNLLRQHTVLIKCLQLCVDLEDF